MLGVAWLWNYKWCCVSSVVVRLAECKRRILLKTSRLICCLDCLSCCVTKSYVRKYSLLLQPTTMLLHTSDSDSCTSAESYAAFVCLVLQPCLCWNWNALSQKTDVRRGGVGACFLGCVLSRLCNTSLTIGSLLAWFQGKPKLHDQRYRSLR